MQFAMPAASAEKCCPVARLLGWDTLRGLAAFLVVLLHAGVPYMVSPFPHLVWPARDADPSMTVDAVVWWAECFIMPLFFVMGGFFSQGLLSSRGKRKFLAGRTRRLLLTQLAAGIVILPPCLLIWTLGWIGDGILTPAQVLQLGFPAEIWDDLWGNSHLWFLQYLYVYCLGLCGICWLRKKFRSANCSKPIQHPRIICCIDSILGSVWKPLLPAIPCAAILYYDTRIVLGFYQTFLPVVSKLAYYWIYFFVGACIYRHRNKLHLHARYGWSYLALSGLIFSVTLPLIREHLGPHATGENRLLLAGLLSLFAWVTTFGLLAVFLNLQLDTRVTRYFAEASFWVYLIHLPLVVLTQIAIVHLPVVTVAKYGIVFAVTMILSLASYQVFVRNRWLGEFLNGQRRSQVPQLGASSPIMVQPILAVLPLPPAIDRKKAG